MLQLPPIPVLPPAPQRHLLFVLLPVVMLLATGGLLLTTARSSGTLLMGGLMAMSMIGVAVSNLQRMRRTGPSLESQRRRYCGEREEARSAATRLWTQRRVELRARHPEPAALRWIAGSAHLWERRSDGSTDGDIRIGIGKASLGSLFAARPSPSQPEDQPDPVASRAADRLLAAFATTPDVPITIDLARHHAVLVQGADSRALIRAMLLQLSASRSPSLCRIAVLADRGRIGLWSWVKWLPHAQHPGDRDALGSTRLITASLESLATWISELAASDLSGHTQPTLTDSSFSEFAASAGYRSAEGKPPRLVVVLDGVPLPTALRVLWAQQSVATLEVGAPDGLALIEGTEPAVLRLGVTDGIVTVADLPTSRQSAHGPQRCQAKADLVDLPLAERTARAMAASARVASSQLRYSKSEETLDDASPSNPTEFDPAVEWAPRPDTAMLRVPIGIDVDGQPLVLDLKEASQGGVGPHGLLVGATGSGKSELLRTLVLRLAATHGPDSLNFVLIDFKGGATFADFEPIPHLSAIITNLSADLALVDRMREALTGEMNRRQQVLRDAGNLASVQEYERARAARNRRDTHFRREGELGQAEISGSALADQSNPLEPLPTLLVICDEFSELLAQKPEFAEVFSAMGRLGRSLGMHLLLASQRLELGRLRGLEAHLSYRIALKTFSAAESHAVIDVPDAYLLPSRPGVGYLRHDGTLRRFTADYVSGPYRERGTVLHERAAVVRPRLFEAARAVEPVREVARSSPPGTDEVSILDAFVERMANRSPHAHRIWLPPLDASPTIWDLQSQSIAAMSNPTMSQSVDSSSARGLRIPLGIVDRPLHQRRDLYWADFAGAEGHGVVVGAPRSGKSTLLRTIVASLALCNSPRDVQCYGVDAGGGALAALGRLPHVGEVTAVENAELVRRTVAQVAGVLSSRVTEFVRLGVDSMTEYRAHRDSRHPSGVAGSSPGDVRDYGDVFLVIDGWGRFTQAFEDLEPQLLLIAQQGLAYGVHLLMSVGRWAELRPGMRDAFGSRWELRLGEPAESEVGRSAAASVPKNRPGRGLTAAGEHQLFALPRLDSVSSSADLSTGLAVLVEAVCSRWPGVAAPAVHLLPERITTDQLPVGSNGTRLNLPVGVRESDLSSVSLDFDSDPHLLVLGDAESGKSSILTMIGAQIVRRSSPEESRFLIVDYRRSLANSIPEEYQAGYATHPLATASYLREVQALLQARMPAAGIPAHQLVDRSWWTGPELWILVDDYDLVQGSAGNPLLPLLEFLPLARDVGLHLVLARRTRGAARAVHEPLIQMLRDSGSPGVLLSGSREEGPLLDNVRASPLPPGRGRLVRRREGVELVQFAMAAAAPTSGTSPPADCPELLSVGSIFHSSALS
jgi:S-DNA-T family DNA segregation ATPase FtsK/SpoIIIE